MAEKLLKNRKRKKASKGKPIRLSDLVLGVLDKQRQNNTKLSYDAYLRKLLGLPKRGNEAQWIEDGRPMYVLEGWVEVNTQKFYLDEADANGAAVLEAAKRKRKKFDKPVRVREVL